MTTPEKKAIDIYALAQKSNITLSEDSKGVLEDVFATNLNLFVTGKAGTGKSTLLKFICKNYNRDVVVLAPTGIAALNINGDTIHSFFKLKPGYELDEAENAKFGKNQIDRLKELDTIIIDEISMVRADILDAIDTVLRRSRKNEFAFGGVRIILFGDLFQLPPTLSRGEEKSFYSRYKSPYFFSAKLFLQKDLFTPAFQLKKLELTHVYRQHDEEFINALNEVRNGNLSDKYLQLLNQRVGVVSNDFKDTPYIHLVTTNKMAYEINNQRLSELKTHQITFYANQNGKTGRIQPNDLTVNVKVGAQVMFINNDAEKRWVNGTIGKITAHRQENLENDNEKIDVIKVRLEDGKEFDVYPHTWEISQYVFKQGGFKRENLGYFTQIPLKLAWAVTIHKSQGKSFNKVVLDLGRGSFAHGQTYVALSRCRSLKGLLLKSKISKSDIIIDEQILNYNKVN